MQEGIAIRADQATEFLASKCPEAAKDLYWQGVGAYGFTTFSFEMLKAMARRAGVARRSGEHSIVCRLKAAAQDYLPAGVDPEIVRRLFAESGATGHRSPHRRERAPGVLLRRING